MSSALVWHVVRDSNAFIRKGINGVIFSAEAGNLYNKHSYKYSGEQSAAIAARGWVIEGRAVDLQRGRRPAQYPKRQGLWQLRSGRLVRLTMA